MKRVGDESLHVVKVLRTVSWLSNIFWDFDFEISDIFTYHRTEVDGFKLFYKNIKCTTVNFLLHILIHVLLKSDKNILNPYLNDNRLTITSSCVMLSCCSEQLLGAAVSHVDCARVRTQLIARWYTDFTGLTAFITFLTLVADIMPSNDIPFTWYRCFIIYACF